MARIEMTNYRRVACEMRKSAISATFIELGVPPTSRNFEKSRECWDVGVVLSVVVLLTKNVRRSCHFHHSRKKRYKTFRVWALRAVEVKSNTGEASSDS